MTNTSSRYHELLPQMKEAARSDPKLRAMLDKVEAIKRRIAAQSPQFGLKENE